VLSVTSLASAFDSTTALSSCNKRSVYDAWGATLRTGYPTFSSGSCLEITSFSPLNAPVSRDTALTILGAQFGTADTSPSAYVTGQPCATTSWTTATQLVCAAPAPILASGTSAVTRPTLSALTARFCRCGSRGVDQSQHEHWEPRLHLRWRVATSRSARRVLASVIVGSAGCEHDTGKRSAERRRRGHDQRVELRHGRPDGDGLADDGGRVRQQRLDVGDSGRVRAASVCRLGGGGNCGECEWSGGHSDRAVQLRRCAAVHCAALCRTAFCCRQTRHGAPLLQRRL
jgi:hypothetical protein